MLFKEIALLGYTQGYRWHSALLRLRLPLDRCHLRLKVFPKKLSVALAGGFWMLA